MKKSLLGSLRESCRTPGKAPIKEMFGGNGEIIQKYGALLTEVGSIREWFTKKEESVFAKLTKDQTAAPVDDDFLKIFTEFFTQVKRSADTLEASLKALEAGGEPIANLGQPSPKQ